MEDSSPLSETDTGWADDFAQTLAVRREQVRQFSGLQRRKWSDLEAELARQIAQIRDELARARKANVDGQAQLLEGRQAMEAAESKLRSDERAVAQLRREHEAEIEQAARQRQRFEAKVAELEQQSEQLSSQQAETKSQRRRIAQELKAHREADRRELERRAAEMERRIAEVGQAESLAGELEQARRRLAEAERQVAAQRTEVETGRERLGELERASKELTAERDLLAAQLADAESRLNHQAPSNQASAGLADDRDQLARRLAAADEELAALRQRLAKAESTAEDAGALADVKRRYELAMDDLRDHKKRVAELEKQLAEAPRGAGLAAAPVAGEKLDWEAQKRRMLAALEADNEDAEEDEDRQAERLKIQEVIAQTDAAIAAKNEEIAELRQLLEAQSGSIGSVAVGAAVFADILSKDEVVQSERERLHQLQQEWEEKLREAEIDLSVQRAKIARERAEIEERQRLLEEQRAQHNDAGDSSDGCKTGRPQRGRWLARLGLKEEE
ncbi:MAG TPA: hypothetical protein VFW87_00170 [Pirellulales bacterium]|nr:hypothetical protein [Pirellulales bacterium]